MTDHNEMLHQIADAIGKFLKKNGGMDNGYNTYVKGCISYNTHQSLNFHTPKTDDLTGHQLIEMGSGLNDKLMKILKAYDYHDDVEIKSTHTEHGCYEMKVQLVVSVRIGSHHFNS